MHLTRQAGDNVDGANQKLATMIAWPLVLLSAAGCPLMAANAHVQKYRVASGGESTRNLHIGIHTSMLLYVACRCDGASPWLSDQGSLFSPRQLHEN